jgi:hypothetical protein
VPAPRKTLFTCPTCRALYQLIRQKAGPETVDTDLTCKVCRDDCRTARASHHRGVFGVPLRKNAKAVRPSFAVGAAAF